MLEGHTHELCTDLQVSYSTRRLPHMTMFASMCDHQSVTPTAHSSFSLSNEPAKLDASGQTRSTMLGLTASTSDYNLVDPHPNCYFNLPPKNGTTYCPAPPKGQNFTDVYMVRLYSLHDGQEVIILNLTRYWHY